MSDERWLRVEDIVDRFQVRPNTVRRWIKSGELRAVSFGGKTGYRIRERDLEEFVKRRESTPDKED